MPIEHDPGIETHPPHQKNVATHSSEYPLISSHAKNLNAFPTSHPWQRSYFKITNRNASSSQRHQCRSSMLLTKKGCNAFFLIPAVGSLPREFLNSYTQPKRFQRNFNNFRGTLHASHPGTFAIPTREISIARKKSFCNAQFRVFWARFVHFKM